MLKEEQRYWYDTPFPARHFGEGMMFTTCITYNTADLFFLKNVTERYKELAKITQEYINRKREDYCYYTESLVEMLFQEYIKKRMKIYTKRCNKKNKK